jgi:hypothetical protein
VERSERSMFGFGGVDPRVLFIPSCPGYTGLTGALDWSDRCNPWWVFARVNVWVCSLLSCVAAVSSLGQFGGRLSCLVIWGFLAVTGVTKPLKLIPYYFPIHSPWPLRNNIEVTCRLCRVKPGKSLTSQDRHLYNNLTRRRVHR